MSLPISPPLGRRLPALLALTMLMLSLQACADANPPPAAVVRAIAAQPTREARTAEIARRLAAVCPTPLADAALERAAAFVETHRDASSVAIVRDLSRLDAEARACRSIGR
jgi:hypothetical protein